VVDDERAMEAWRCRLEHVSIRQSRKWKFVPPSQGESAGEAFRVVRVPVVYSLGRPAKKPSYGVWEGYIPGPRHPSPWGDNEGIGFSPDTSLPAAPMSRVRFEHLAKERAAIAARAPGAYSRS
jgi:hypothetical protein